MTMTDERLAEIKAKLHGVVDVPPDVLGAIRAWQDVAFRFAQYTDELLADNERLRAREAALVAEREQAMTVVREVAEATEVHNGAADYAQTSWLAWPGLTQAGQVREAARALLTYVDAARLQPMTHTTHSGENDALYEGTSLLTPPSQEVLNILTRNPPLPEPGTLVSYVVLEKVMERHWADYAKLQKIVERVAEADNSDNSVCYQLCSYDIRWTDDDHQVMTHSAPCVVEQARTLLGKIASQASTPHE